MWQSPAIAQSTGVVSLPGSTAGWPQRALGVAIPLQAAAVVRGMGFAPSYPDGGWPRFAAPAVMRIAPAYETTDTGSFSLLDPQGTAAIRLPKEGLLSAFGAGFRHPAPPWPEDAPPFDLFWPISDDAADDDQPRSRWDRYPQYGGLAKLIADWRAQRVKDVVNHNGRRYHRQVWELINAVATATPDTATALHKRIDSLLQHDHTTRNIFHKYLEDRLAGDTEEDTRALLLEDASIDRMAVRQMRDLAARALARRIMNREVSGLEFLGEQLPSRELVAPTREQVQIAVTPELLADLQHALDAYLEIRQQYEAVRAARHEYPAETRRESLVQMNDLVGAAFQELARLTARADGRLLEAGINFLRTYGLSLPGRFLRPQRTVAGKHRAEVHERKVPAISSREGYVGRGGARNPLEGDEGARGYPKGT